LLVADRRYDWQRARGDGANESLVAEREQVLEAPAAAREDDDVDVRSRAELLERVDDRLRGKRSLHVGLGDKHLRGRKPGRDRCQDVPLGRRIAPGDKAHATGTTGQRTLTLGRERAPAGEFALHPLALRGI